LTRLEAPHRRGVQIECGGVRDPPQDVVEED